LPQRVCYEATIPVPSSGDEDWDNGELAVRVLGHGGPVRLLLGDTLPGGTSVRMDAVGSWGAERREPYVDTDLKFAGPACGKGTYPTEVVISTYIVEATAQATGFERPSFQFAVNGAPAGSPSLVHSPLQHGQVTFVAEVEVPNGYRSWQSERREITADYNVRGNQLGLTLPEYDGTYQVTVAVTAVESPNTALKASASSTVSATTAEVALSQAAKDALGECTSFLSKYVVVDTSLVPDLLSPIERLVVVLQGLVSGDEEIDVEQMALTLRELPNLQQRAPWIARHEAETLAAKLDIDQAELRRIVDQLAPSA
jgi:hypothetical protein